MSRHMCPHERDVLDLVAVGQWPRRADAALQAHVEECGMCAEVASIATAVREWGGDAPPARLPDSSIVWHRAQLRAKTEAARAAARPLWVAQAFALAALIVAMVWIGPSVAWYSSVWQRLTASAAPASLNVPDATVQPAEVATSVLVQGWGWSALTVLGIAVVLISLVMAAVRLAENRELLNSK